MPGGSHEHFAAIDVLAYLLGTQPSGRLYRNVVEAGHAADTLISTFRLKEPGVLLVGAEVRREGGLSEAVQAMLASLQGIADEPPTAEEVERAKTAFAADFELAFNDPGAVSGTLSEWASLGDWRLMFLHRDRVAEVTAADVLAVAKAYLKTSNRTVGYFYPADETPPRAEIPPSPDVAALISGYTGGKTVAEGEAFEPTPENIETRTSSPRSLRSTQQKDPWGPVVRVVWAKTTPGTCASRLPRLGGGDWRAVFSFGSAGRACSDGDCARH